MGRIPAMQAVRFHRQGPPEVLALEQVPSPGPPGPGQVLLDIHAAGVNHLDIWIRREVPGVSLPRIPGADAAGTVRAVGPGVDRVAPGDRVLINPGWSCRTCVRCLAGEASLCPDYGILGESCDGAYCSELLVSAEACYPIPDGWSFAEAASFPLVAITSWRMCVTRGKLQAGETVLILGGAAGVGVLSIQIAKGLGCRVIATASTEEKRSLCKALGADHVLDYSDQGWGREVRALTGKQGVDVTVDYVGKATWAQSLRLTRSGGRVLTCGATTGRDPTTDLNHIFFRQLSILGSTMGSPSDLEQALTAAGDGRLRPVLDRTLPLAEAARAHQLIEDRAVLGKLVLEVSR
ncbi:MAG: zinc-binding dehydrogenase [Myxococcota bacterium]|nr:zinc-binding dehydrogenase [Myxococcota bacterium]